uniref:EGF-like domain-containing protein n=1 Tax=Panagrolaimus superbus TaxID=310955 RepID=A0A914YXK1_9BILA
MQISTTKSIPNSDTTVFEAETKSTVTNSEQENKISSTFPSTTPPSTTVTTESLQTSSTSSPCASICPSNFYEGENACYKFIQLNNSQEFQFDDFQNACNSLSGVIASLSDFNVLKNVALFNKMKDSQNSNITLTFTNAVPTKTFKLTQIIRSIDMTKLTYGSMTVTGLSANEKYANLSAICRIGKFCEEYTCPIEEYFMSASAEYFKTAESPSTVLKAGETLNVQCTAIPKRSFQLKCDPRGYLIPDSSMIKCQGDNQMESEPEGFVKLCENCDKFNTESCEELPTGDYQCICKKYFSGETCRYPINACTNITCKNGGICVNRFSYAFCQCQAKYFGDICQYEYYISDEAWLMRMIVNVAVVVAVAEPASRTRKRPTSRFSSIKGKLWPVENDTASFNKFCKTLFHEMAHQWFGNLVTMVSINAI